MGCGASKNGANDATKTPGRARASHRRRRRMQEGEASGHLDSIGPAALAGSRSSLKARRTKMNTLTPKHAGQDEQQDQEPEQPSRNPLADPQPPATAATRPSSPEADPGPSSDTTGGGGDAHVVSRSTSQAQLLSVGSKFTLSHARGAPAANSSVPGAAPSRPASQAHSTGGGHQHQQQRGGGGHTRGASNSDSSGQEGSGGDSLNDLRCRSTVWGSDATSSGEAKRPGIAMVAGLSAGGTASSGAGSAARGPGGVANTPAQSMFQGQNFSRVAVAPVITRIHPSALSAFDEPGERRKLSDVSNAHSQQQRASSLQMQQQRRTSPSRDWVDSPRQLSVATGSSPQLQPGLRSVALTTHSIGLRYQHAFALIHREGYQRRRQLVLGFMRPATASRIRSWIDHSDHGETAELGPLTDPMQFPDTTAKMSRIKSLGVAFSPPKSFGELLQAADQGLPESMLRSFTLKASRRPTLVSTPPSSSNNNVLLLSPQQQQPP